MVLVALHLQCFVPALYGDYGCRVGIGDVHTDMAVVLAGRACWPNAITSASHQHGQSIRESRHKLGLPSATSVTLDYLSVYIPSTRDDGVELTGDGYLRTPSVLRK